MTTPTSRPTLTFAEDHILDEIHVVYEASGSDAAMIYFRTHFPDGIWSFCVDCEDYTPNVGHLCAICWGQVE